MPSPLLILVLVCLAAIAALGAAWAARRRRAWERRHFPSGRGTPARFLAGRSLRALPLTRMGDDTWQVPAGQGGETALVLFDGRATGKNPRVRVEAADLATQHHAPPRWAGSWMLDLTPIWQRAQSGPARLSSAELTIVSSPQLWISAERPGPEERILILAPHPDDAELAAFGFYARRTRQVHLVTLTAGERGAGSDQREPAGTTHARAAKRARESFDIPALAGVGRAQCHNLLLPDGGLAALLADPEREHAVPYDRVRLADEFGDCRVERVTGNAWVAAFRRLIREIQPAIIVCPDPLRDDHPDHRATGAALASALREAAPTSLRALYLYVVHSSYSDIAPFGPMHAPWDPAPAVVDTSLDAFYSEVLDEEVLARKRRAVEACSDVDAFLRTDPAFAQSLATTTSWFADDPSSLFRRCLRRSEWFRVIAPERFIAAHPVPPRLEIVSSEAPRAAAKTATPTVSILIPAYNAGAWIERCIRSALEQTQPPLEVLVQDDGSTDNTREIVDRFGDRIRRFYGPNLGGNRVRNQLLAAARGEWVQFLDADDELLVDKIERQLAEAGNLDEIDVIYSPTIDEIWQGGQPVASHITNVYVESDHFVQWILWQISQTNGSLWRRSALEKMGGWNENQPCCQDNELYARALREGLRFRFAPSARSVHRTWSNQSVSTRDPLLVVRERARLIATMGAWLRATGRWRPAHAAASGQIFFELARTWARFDLPGATEFYRTRKAEGLIHLSGAAAPPSYRVLLALLGFPRTEVLLRRRRKLAHRPGS